MSLQVAVGHASLTGPRERNEDFCGVVTPRGAELDNKGLIAAVADGIGGHRGGREAAEYTVRGLLSDYYATPDTWSVPHALDRVVGPLNRWVLAEGGRQPELAGMATTLSVLVLRGRRYVLAHVGDSRIYLLREGRLDCLTEDHVWEHPELKNVLSRAVGLDRHFRLDFADGELQPGDCFLLCTDGVWGALDDARLRETLLAHPGAQAAAAALCSLALAAGGRDNASAVVLRVEALPTAGLRDALAETARLPLPPLLKPGQTLDGLVIDERLHASRASLLYRVHDRASGQAAVLKTLPPACADDAEAMRGLIMEEWRVRRVVSPFFAQHVPVAQRSCLYFLQSWHEGASLQRMLDQGLHFTVADVVQHGIRLLKGLAALHRLDIAHRDIKPDNIHLGRDGRLRILDLGVAQSLSEREGEGGSEGQGAPGTPSYMAPELFAGAPADTAQDLYATGVTLYHLLTRRYPQGEIEPFQHPRFGDPLPPTRYRPDIPGWLENVLLKAVAREPGQRFETAEEFLRALEQGASRPVNRIPATPLALRNPLLTWRLLAAASALLNLVLLMLLLR